MIDYNQEGSMNMKKQICPRHQNIHKYASSVINNEEEKTEKNKLKMEKKEIDRKHTSDVCLGHSVFCRMHSIRRIPQTHSPLPPAYSVAPSAAQAEAALLGRMSAAEAVLLQAQSHHLLPLPDRPLFPHIYINKS